MKFTFIYQDKTSANVIIVPFTQHVKKSAFGINEYYDNHARQHLTDALFQRATCTIVVFIDRGLSIKTPLYEQEMTTRSKRSELMAAVIESPQVVYIIFNGGKEAREAVTFGMYFTHFNGIRIKILRVDLKAEAGVLFTGPIETLESSRTLSDIAPSDDERLINMAKAMTNVSVEILGNGEGGIVEYLSARAVTNDDLVLVGRSYYEHAAVKQFVDHDCKSSCLIVQRNSIQETAQKLIFIIHSLYLYFS